MVPVHLGTNGETSTRGIAETTTVSSLMVSVPGDTTTSATAETTPESSLTIHLGTRLAIETRATTLHPWPGPLPPSHSVAPPPLLCHHFSDLIPGLDLFSPPIAWPLLYYYVTTSLTSESLGAENNPQKLEE